MVTKLADKRGQITMKGHEVTDDWEQLIKVAAGRNGQTFAGFVVDTTRDAALAIVKGQSAVPAAVPMRIEDIATGLADQVAALEQRQDARIAALGDEQRDRLDRLERASRRGRWRR